MADSPDPNGPHPHLYEPHLLARARAAAAAGAPARVVICCVICSATTTVGPPPSVERDVVDDVAAPPSAVHPSVEVRQVEVVGCVEAAVVTWQRGTWRVVIAATVVFAREGDGCAQALRAAGQAGQEVRVLARRIRADLWVDAVHRR